MYIKTNKNVIEIISELEKENLETKLKFFIYVVEQIDNNLVNEKNSANPSLEEDEFKILDFNTLGVNSEIVLIDYLLSELYKLTKEQTVYNGGVLGINYSSVDYLIKLFESLNFVEKLDLISELFIRYDNDTLFLNAIMSTGLDISGYEIANNIMRFK